MFDIKTKDKVNGIMAAGFTRMVILIGDGDFARAKSLARAFSQVSPSSNNDEVNYDWNSFLEVFESHYKEYPLKPGEPDFHYALSALWKNHQ